MTRFLSRLFAIILLATLAGCAATEPAEEKTVEQILADKNLKIVEPVDYLINFNIRGWQYVNLEHVVLDDGPSKNYLVELNTPCRNLEWAQRIAFTSFGRQVTKHDRILVTDGSGHVDRCPIKAFYKLERIE